MATSVTDAPAEQRFEIREDGVPAGFAAYRIVGDRIAFHHTEVFDGFEGRGLALRLVDEALAEVRRRGLAVLPVCPYVRRVISRAPEKYLDLVPADVREGFGLPPDAPVA